MLSNALIVVTTVVLMELFSIVAHKYIMHGFGWGWHKSHHEPRTGLFEKNDLYAVVFAGVAIAPMLTGAAQAQAMTCWASTSRPPGRKSSPSATPVPSSPPTASP